MHPLGRLVEVYVAVLGQQSLFLRPSGLERCVVLGMVAPQLAMTGVRLGNPQLLADRTSGVAPLRPDPQGRGPGASLWLLPA